MRYTQALLREARAVRRRTGKTVRGVNRFMKVVYADIHNRPLGGNIYLSGLLPRQTTSNMGENHE